VGYAVLLLPAARAFWVAQLPEWDRGLIAMGVNATVVIVVTLLFPAQSSRQSPR
jgi:SSS family solute:Na+ symporter